MRAWDICCSCVLTGALQSACRKFASSGTSLVESLKISLFDHPFIVVSKRESDVFIEEKLWKRLMFLLCVPLVFGTVRLRVCSAIIMAKHL